MRSTRLMILAFAASCADPAYVELFVADERLPFLAPNVDFDALGVEARAPDCANTMVEYPPEELPATLIVLPGDCFQKEVELQAFALLDEKRIAQSSWLSLTFPEEGARVATATLAGLPGPQIRFRTSFEVGQPIELSLVKERDILNRRAETDAGIAVEGSRSIMLSGSATSTNSHVLIRAASTDLLLKKGDRLFYAMRIDSNTAPPTIGVDVVLSSGKNAFDLMLVDQEGHPVHPASQAGRSRDVWQRYIVDLTAAANTRLVGFWIGFDARMGGGPGDFVVHLDDVWIESSGEL
jgi:hypothetical protein